MRERRKPPTRFCRGLAHVSPSSPQKPKAAPGRCLTTQGLTPRRRSSNQEHRKLILRQKLRTTFTTGSLRPYCAASVYKPAAGTTVVA